MNKQVEDNLGRVHPYVAPLAISLFFFILFCNWLELLPTELNHDLHLLPAPTADTNLTYALAAVTMVSVWAYGIRQKGAKGYFKHFLEPFPVLLPLNILEELVKPITLALRLFGNIFAGGIMLALIGADPDRRAVGPQPPLEGLRRASIGVIQAFIFALLTILYFAMAGAGHDDDHDEAARDRRGRRSARGNPRTCALTGPPPDRQDSTTARQVRQRHRHPVRNQGETWLQQKPRTPSSWLAPSSAAAWPSPAAPSVPVSVTVWPVRRTSRAWLASPRPRAASRRSSS